MRQGWAIVLLLMLTPAGFIESAAWADTPPGVDASQEQLISLQFPPNLELKVLIHYVGDRLGINFIYDEQAVAQRITLVSPVRVSKESLLGLLQSALKMKGLIVVDGDQPGWKKILPAASLASAAVSSGGTAGAASRPSEAVTQVFALRYADPQKSESVIKPFLTQPGGNSIPLAEQRLLIVSDFASNVARVADLIKLLDQPPQEVSTRFLVIKNLEVSLLVPQIQQILTALDKAQPSPGGDNSLQQMVTVLDDPRTNQLILIGPPAKVSAAQATAVSLDVPLPLETRVYTLRSLPPDRLDKLVRELIDPLDLKRLYQSAVDKEAGMLIVTSTPAIQQRVAALKDQLDVPVREKVSPIRFYKLTNSTAADVLATIRSLEGGQEQSGAGAVGPVEQNAMNPSGQAFGNSPSSPSGSSGANNLSAPSSPSASSPGGGGFSSPETSTAPPLAMPFGTGGNSPAPAGAPSSASSGQPIVGVHTADATVTADPNTNTIIVEADPATQKVYEGLIKTLDKRRPQVLIECTLVTLDTSNDFSLGVELGADSKGNTKVITFDSFGLSTPSPSSGVLTLTPAAGFNGTLLGSSVAQVVIQALQTCGRAKVLSAPRILVNDNATGTLQSVQEQPYTSVNASTTVATTSFAGYADAGTTITLTPHISEGDHLQLEYNVSLNNFTGSSSNGVPPPRQTDSVQSQITIPDDSTVIVGGLNSTTASDTRQTVPILGDIPLLKYLFTQQTRDDDRSTLFVFIRPLILRDDEFQDLKFFSERDADEAGIPGDYPKSEPLLIP